MGSRRGVKVGVTTEGAIRGNAEVAQEGTGEGGSIRHVQTAQRGVSRDRGRKAIAILSRSTDRHGIPTEPTAVNDLNDDSVGGSAGDGPRGDGIIRPKRSVPVRA